MRVITYGTFDLFHEGHRSILERAKALGDYLIVGVTSDSFDQARGKLNVVDTLATRMANVERSGYANRIIVEEQSGQKILDILKYRVDIFVVGSDWQGTFDYLQEYCKVQYLPRSPGISSTLLRENSCFGLRIGAVGIQSLIASFVAEAKFVSGVHVECELSIPDEEMERFLPDQRTDTLKSEWDRLLKSVDVVYVATPLCTHFCYAREALLAGKHVLCEKPLALHAQQVQELYDLAESGKTLLLEALITAFAPVFDEVLTVAKSGMIGRIKMVQATVTKPVQSSESTPCSAQNSELIPSSVSELGSYPLFAAIKLFGIDFGDVHFTTFRGGANMDLLTKMEVLYDSAVACLTVGLGVQAKGDMVVAGTKGYLYIPAPWWKSSSFEVRFADSSVKKFQSFFEGDGIRYELAHVASLLRDSSCASYRISRAESAAIAEIIEHFHEGKNTRIIH